jgi:hypothetical protein
MESGIQCLVRLAKSLPGRIGSHRFRSFARPTGVFYEQRRKSGLEMHICAEERGGERGEGGPRSVSALPILDRSAAAATAYLYDSGRATDRGCLR